MEIVMGYRNFVVEHKNQLELQNIPEPFWYTLFLKLSKMNFDAGMNFELKFIQYDENDTKEACDPDFVLFAKWDMKINDLRHIYLIDHAWTFSLNKMKNNLMERPDLLSRLSNYLLIDRSLDPEQKVKLLQRSIWKYADTYTVVGEVDSMQVWYVNDEVGCGVTHSDEPNFRAVPFIYGRTQEAFTVLFPIKDVAADEAITKDFCPGTYSSADQREAMLIPWKKYEHFDAQYTQEEPLNSYFLEGHIVESLPTIDDLPTKIPVKRTIKVYSEYENIRKHLTSPQFEIVDNEAEADVLWYLKHFKDYKQLSENTPHKYVNQFPFEYVITIKDLLAVVSRRCSTNNVELDALGTYPVWLPTTFNMKTELPQFASYFNARSKADLDNTWICKPFNLARGLGIQVTDNLAFICNYSRTGPFICQKYVEDPVLFNRPEVGMVKFDVRYVLMLTSVNPTEVYVYSNYFLRFGNKLFALENFEDYEQHFTVMNYTDAPLHKMLASEFRRAWDDQYPENHWSSVEAKIFEMLKELFTAATSKEPPRGIAPSPQSRALYAADIMIGWQQQNGEKVMQPKLLEINWMPDCDRACDYYPDFFNDCFATMFLNKEVPTCVKIL